MNIELSAKQACIPNGKAKTYFIQGAQTGLVKIGRTSLRIGYRFTALQVGSPDLLILLKITEGDREKEFHKRFAHLRQHGEWFTPAPELLEFIKEL